MYSVSSVVNNSGDVFAYSNICFFRSIASDSAIKNIKPQKITKEPSKKPSTSEITISVICFFPLFFLYTVLLTLIVPQGGEIFAADPFPGYEILWKIGPVIAWILGAWIIWRIVFRTVRRLVSTTDSDRAD